MTEMGNVGICCWLCYILVGQRVRCWWNWCWMCMW